MSAITSSRWWARTTKTGIASPASWSNVAWLLPSSVVTTTSGRRATIASRLGATMPPTRRFRRAAGGQSQKSVTPTRRSSPPRAKMISVALGTRETIRCGGAGSVSG